MSRRFSFRAQAANFCRSQLLQKLAGARRAVCLQASPGMAGASKFFRNLLPFYFGIAVKNDVAKIREEFGGAIARGWENGKSSGDSSRKEVVTSPARKPRMIDYVFDEGNIRFHGRESGNFAEGAVHALGKPSGRFCAPGRHF